MPALLYLIVFAVTIAILYMISRMFQSIAQEKGYDEARYFWMPFLFGFIGYLLVIALPDRRNTTSYTDFAGKQNSVCRINSHGNESKFPEIEYDKTVKCETCANEVSKLFKVKISDDYGVRYRRVCADCLNRFNCTPDE